MNVNKPPSRKWRYGRSALYGAIFGMLGNLASVFSGGVDLSFSGAEWIIFTLVYFGTGAIVGAMLFLFLAFLRNLFVRERTTP
jgi:hypothetical protein